VLAGSDDDSGDMSKVLMPPRDLKPRMVTTIGGIFSALLLVLAAPTPAQAAVKSGACPSWVCGSISWTDVKHTNGRLIGFYYNLNVRDKTCHTGSNARIGLRVWYTDGSSQYAAGSFFSDNEPCDDDPFLKIGRVFDAPAGKTISYFKAVFRDSDHTAGLLGNKADFVF
jgi:hypothetical protein